MSTPLLNQIPIINGLIVVLPDYSTMQAAHSGLLSLPNLPLKAKISCKFPNIAKSLISISALCDEEGSATFTKSQVHL